MAKLENAPLYLGLAAVLLYCPMPESIQLVFKCPSKVQVGAVNSDDIGGEKKRNDGKSAELFALIRGHDVLKQAEIYLYCITVI